MSFNAITRFGVFTDIMHAQRTVNTFLGKNPQLRPISISHAHSPNGAVSVSMVFEVTDPANMIGAFDDQD